jgi:hypothetical protein
MSERWPRRCPSETVGLDGAIGSLLAGIVAGLLVKEGRRRFEHKTSNVGFPPLAEIGGCGQGKAMAIVLRLLALLLLVLHASPAWTACSGASVDQEYREADVVVRARVLAGRRIHGGDEPSRTWRARWGEYTPVMLHRLRVSQVFKGQPGPSINLFQEVTSGRLEVDVGQDYLIFLSYIRPYRSRGSAARGAMYVRYACGQSRPWQQVTPRTHARLRALSRRLASSKP